MCRWEKGWSCDSWSFSERNYKVFCSLWNGQSHCFESDFSVICTDADGPAPLELPNQWLWDIIDEFIYQVSGQP